MKNFFLVIGIILFFISCSGGDDSTVDEIVWAQEEPRNMGAWGHLLMHLDKAKEFRVASRRFYGAPASGSKARFDKRHNEVIEYVFDKSKNNFKK